MLLDIKGLEVHYGLVYVWYDQDETRWNRGPGEWEWNRTDSNRHTQTFDDFGFYNLTDVAVMVWF